VQEDQEFKERIAGIFHRAAATYDRIGPRRFSYWARRLVDLADIPEGARVLDVATGRGAVLFLAAERVGPQGHVIGVDLAEAMVQLTADEITQRGLATVEVRQMDAEQLQFPDNSFDHVLCAFGLFLFPRPDRALAEFARVMRPGGTLAVIPVMWSASPGQTEWFNELLRAYVVHSESLQRYQRLIRSLPDFSTGPELEEALHRAGFVGIRIVPEEAEFIYADEEEWWATLWSDVRRAWLEQMEPDVLEQFQRDVFERLQAFKGADGIRIRAHTLVALAQKPALP
jgi:O-methyltransferase/aklanonic acid methyltransferase